ncbi:hypothetical protein JI58_07120 [Marinosulfonomonas sp. PRT-SC04]|nr:hypothetical protein JI58_07120 [Marinosulfonomonas sp. PRT-SC04]
MTYQEDPRLIEAKAIPMSEIVDRIGIAGLKNMSGELIGPCPLCGGRDRFGINLRSNAFLCRKCDVRGGDQIALVQQVLNLDFLEALGWLCGDKPASIDPVEMQRRRDKAAESQRKQDEYAAKARAFARRNAQEIWGKGRNQDVTMLRDYFAVRGITTNLLPDIPTCLRLIPDHPYVKKIGGQLGTAHRGPCMIGLIQGPDDRGAAVHQTWLDVTRLNGKAVISQNGEALPAKMVRGSKKGGAIRLWTPLGADTLVMGEGIETTLTAMVAQAIPDAAYWCAVDLGNMSGKMLRGKGKRFAGVPDMQDRDAFVPPPWVKRLVFIMDGDSEPKLTRAKLEAGLRRAMAYRDGLVCQIVQAGDGVDLNDVLKGQGDD